ncbi:MAG: homoserine kinase [Pseudomonadota bacterium]|nr:homoserine kinase [Pseudomonadota bacterium]
MAVYTKVSHEDARQFLADYAIGEFRELKGIQSGVSNSNFFLTTSLGRFVLTLYEARTNEKDLPFFIGLMDHLAAQGFACPRPVRNKAGRALGRLSGRAAVIVEFLPGTPLNRVTPEECAEAGRGLAALHLGVSGFSMSRPNDLSLEGWEKLLSACGARADDVQPGLFKLLRTELDALQWSWPKALPRGVIHADMFPNNVFFDGTKLCGVIDFYFACEDYFAYDLAICLNAWCFENGASFNVTKARALASGYTQKRPLSAEEISAIPVLARGASIRFLLTRLYDWLHPAQDALLRPLDPLEYLTRLQFHQMAKNPEAYGLGT